MNKEAYNKFKYYLKSLPDFKKISESTLVYYCTYANGMAGVKIAFFDDEKSLKNFETKLKKKVFEIGQLPFYCQMHHNETQLSIYEEYLDGWSSLYDLIQEKQRSNKTEFHWEYRDYNFLWRGIIISARDEITKFKELNQAWYDLHFNSLETFQKDKLVINEITNVLLIENTLNYIESEIKKTNFYEQEVDFKIEKREVGGLKITALEKIIRIFNYSHPTINKHVRWRRGIRIHFDNERDRYNIDVQVLYKNKTRNGATQKPQTPEEAFKKQYINDSENTQYHFVKLGRITYPLYNKYIFPFYKVNNSSFYIKRIIEEFKDELNYNLIFSSKNIEKYFNRISYCQQKLLATKSELESILKPFNPTKFDSNFFEYLDSLLDRDKDYFKPWCRYDYHDHKLIHCVEVQHEYVEKMIDLFNNLQEHKSVESIKLFYSEFDQLFQVDPAQIIELLETLGITTNKVYDLDKKKFGAVRGVLDACIEQKIMIENNLTDNFKVIARHIKLGTDKLPDTSNLSEKYRKESNRFIMNNIKNG